MPPHAPRALLTALALVPLTVGPGSGQEAEALGRTEALRAHHPDLHDLVGRLELAHALLFEELTREGEAVRARGDGSATAGLESEIVDRLTGLVRGEGRERAAEPTRIRYTALGPRGAEIIGWGQAFQREVLSILADPEVTDPRGALADAVSRYESREGVALPSEPKDMDVLYGHPFARDFRTGYADLDGFIWAGHWLRLAATEPLTDLAPGAERAAGIDTVTTRYYAKLSFGEPPESFPSELPLAPAIAPGLIWLSPESAMIWDNLSMLLEVLADVLASPDVPDVPGAIEATLDFFTDPELSITDRDEWEIMALRHGIFFQGGYPLAVMTGNERNAGGHAVHLRGGRMLMAIPGMPRR